MIIFSLGQERTLGDEPWTCAMAVPPALCTSPPTHALPPPRPALPKRGREGREGVHPGKAGQLVPGCLAGPSTALAQVLYCTVLYHRTVRLAPVSRLYIRTCVALPPFWGLLHHANPQPLAWCSLFDWRPREPRSCRDHCLLPGHDTACRLPHSSNMHGTRPFPSLRSDAYLENSARSRPMLASHAGKPALSQ